MNPTTHDGLAAICERHGNDPTRLLDIAIEVQRQFGCVDATATRSLSQCLGIAAAHVEAAVSFYGFLAPRPTGRYVIRLCDDVIDELKGAHDVAAGLEQELGIRFGETTPDGWFTLQYTSCIGMSDQAPAALVNDVVVTRLRPGAAREMVRALRGLEPPADLRRVLVQSYGDGNNSNDLVRSMVDNNLRVRGKVIFADMEPGAALSRALTLSPAEVIRQVKTARLRGRGGAGFPTGMKWEFARAAPGPERCLVANADEGEPGTFKDRVILTERPDLLFEGMTIAGYAIGADLGLLYLRGEYAYLRPFLERILERRRAAGLLGDRVLGKDKFRFDIRIQMGAGAYICGEETALLNSCEGLRGDPRTRPPFPAQAGYLGRPTAVNNVETLCCAARILEMGSGWFAEIGTRASAGTKLLSISGDCTRPGVYELAMGTPLRSVFACCGAEDPIAVQVGGPSGRMVGPADFDRTICFDDLATGGALMIFGPGRDVLRIASRFLGFFIHESCGYCTPCRVGNVLLKERLDRILAGRGQPSDLEYLQDLADVVRTASRCGLGQTSPNPVLSTLANFRGEYERRLEGAKPAFDLEAAVAEATHLTRRDPMCFDGD